MLLAPVSPVVAWPLGEHADDPLQMYLKDVYTLSLNLAGLPGLSLPVGLGRASGLPVGMQLIGEAFSEERLLCLAAVMEEVVAGVGHPTL